MISNFLKAEETICALNKIVDDLNSTIIELSNGEIVAEELSEYKKRAGTVIYTIYEKIMLPLYEAHNDLIPEKRRRSTLSRIEKLKERGCL